MSILDVLEEKNPWWREPQQRGATLFPHRRRCFEPLWRALLDPRSRRAVLLLGPRQVGKTVLLRQVADALLDLGLPPRNVVFAAMDDPRLRNPSLSAVLEAARAVTDPSRPRFFLLDEVQAAEPGWDRVLKDTIDALGPPGSPVAERFLLAGSAAQALRAAERESGLGRWDELAIEGLSFRESLELLGQRPPERLDQVHYEDYVRYLERGGFPEHLWDDSASRARERLRDDIVDKAILRDLLRTGVDVGGVRNLFCCLVQRSGALVETTHLAQDLGCDRRSVESWVELLKDTRLLMPLEQRLVSEKQRGRLRRRSKLFASDHGLVMAFSALAAPAQDPEVRGMLFECAVFRHLRELAAADRSTLGFLRWDEDLEVDFVIEGPRGVALIEVTSAREPKPRKLERLVEAARRVKADHLWLVTDGIAEESRGAVRVLPLLGLLLWPERVWEAS